MTAPPELPRATSGRTAEDVARECARLAASIIAPKFEEVRAGGLAERTAKGRGNFVTETDLACERAVLELLRSEYPDHRVLSEETSASVHEWDHGWLWVVDPLDGTGNFARGIPTFAFNIALCRDGEPVLGLTHQPPTGEEFFAAEGCGTFLNGKPVRVSPVETLADSLMAIGLGYQYDRAGMLLQLLSEVWPRVQMIQNIGTAALGLAYAASGRFDLYVHSNLYPWDMAPGIILVREAGGVFLEREGKPITLYSEGVVAGAPGPARDFLELTAGRRWR